MQEFDSKVQYLKYRVLTEVARAAFEDRLLEAVPDIPHLIVPGKVSTMRCCVYKERAILAERVKLAMGGDRKTDDIIKVIDIACEECPVGGYEVTEACRGCIAHRCEKACPRGAITFDSKQRAIINKDKCVECGKCSEVCPFNAIKNNIRPCVVSCKAKAISMDEEKIATVDSSKCTSCGACVYQCPFGAIMGKSWILDAVKLIKESAASGSQLYAIVAPAIVTQFLYVKPGQIISALYELGFTDVREVAEGADMAVLNEARELSDKGMLFTSCCPSFVDYIKKSFPDLEKYLSENLSPMALLAKKIKEENPSAKVVFIGPCTAKKEEVQWPSVREYVDCAITFEELQALFDSKNIDISLLPEKALTGASSFGRGFARSGGVAGAVKEALKETGHEDFDFKPICLNGIGEFRSALVKLSKGLLDANFVEGMACEGGCIGGAGCLRHDRKGSAELDRFADKSEYKTISEALKK